MHSKRPALFPGTCSCVALQPKPHLGQVKCTAICVPLVIPEICAPNQAFAIPGARHNQTDPLAMAKAENLASCTASSATQCRSNPVSDRGLPKTGIFQISAGDYQRFRSHRGRFRSPETDSRFAKARHWRAFLSLLRAKSPVVGLPGWGGRIRTSVWWNQNQRGSLAISIRILTKSRNLPLDISIG
jgi:hypothetical protein